MLNSVLKYSAALAIVLFVLPTSASAHVASGTGFSAGATHPLLGLDHILAMFAVGIISMQMGGKALWSVPATFIGAMIVGGIFGIMGISIPFVELGIAASVLIFGVMIAISKKLPLSLALASTAFFALFHGHAHGTEISGAAPALYITGFVLSTVLLHATGILTGLLAKKTALSIILIRTSGAAISVTGLAFLLGI